MKARDTTGTGSDGRGRTPGQVPRRIQVRPRTAEDGSELPAQPLLHGAMPVRAPATRREAREMAAAAAAQARVAQNPRRRARGRHGEPGQHTPAPIT